MWKNSNTNNIKLLEDIFKCKAHLSLLILNLVLVMDPVSEMFVEQIVRNKL